MISLKRRMKSWLHVGSRIRRISLTRRIFLAELSCFNIPAISMDGLIEIMAKNNFYIDNVGFSDFAAAKKAYCKIWLKIIKHYKTLLKLTIRSEKFGIVCQ